MYLEETTERTESAPSILPCNFRASGLLSNESLRQLRSMHEAFARTLSHSLDLSLGSTLEVKLSKIDQISVREFAATLATGSYLVPFSVEPRQDRIIAKFENSLLFPLLDLLLGGSGDPVEHARELTEIDEELFRSVTELMCIQLERAWKGCNVTAAPMPSIRPAVLGQMFAIEERALALQFEIRLVASSSSFMLVLPMPFAGALVRSSQAEATRRSGIRPDAAPRFQDRLLQCSMRLCADLPNLNVPLGDLVALQVSSVLDLGVPANTPVQLQIDGYSIFDIAPVRKGKLKAAQLSQARTDKE